MAKSEVEVQSRADLLVQSVTDYAIYMLDPTGTIVSWNAGAQRFKGYTADEIIGEHFSRFYSAEDRAAGIPKNALRTALEQGRFEAEGWRYRKDGTRFWANVVIDPIRDETGKHVGFAKVTRDLTDRRAAEEALRRSEERFRLLVQSVTDYAIYMLDPNGRVTSWNAGAERFKGYTADEIIGEHFSKFYQPEDRDAGVPARALDTAITEGRFEAEGWRVRKDGSRFWANVVIDPVRDEAGNHVGFAKITRDLTERKLSQEALQQAQEQFFQSQKMEAIGKLTGGIAHDFNNLLSAILGSLDLAKRRMAQGEDVSRFLDNAVMAAERGANLIQRMLAFARKQELTIEAVDLSRSMRDMAELLTRTLGASYSIDTRFPLVLPKVCADPTQLELALVNLVVNARDAMPGGGQIVVQARTGDGTAAGLLAGEYVCLSVQDSGQGMKPEVLHRAIEPFFTTKGIGKGTGLGLSMVQGMVEQCGGKFVLRSELDKGTTAELWLPVAHVDPKGSIASVQRSEAPSIRSLNVLAVDDDPIVLVNTAAMLAELGHKVFQATGGRAALDVLGREDIDLLLTDYAMPDMNGSELAEAGEQRQPGLHVIVVSGYADLPEGVALKFPRLAKPFREHQLAAIISHIAGAA